MNVRPIALLIVILLAGVEVSRSAEELDLSLPIPQEPPKPCITDHLFDKGKNEAEAIILGLPKNDAEDLLRDSYKTINNSRLDDFYFVAAAHCSVHDDYSLLWECSGKADTSLKTAALFSCYLSRSHAQRDEDLILKLYAAYPYADIPRTEFTADHPEHKDVPLYRRWFLLALANCQSTNSLRLLLAELKHYTDAETLLLWVHNFRVGDRLLSIATGKIHPGYWSWGSTKQDRSAMKEAIQRWDTVLSALEEGGLGDSVCLYLRNSRKVLAKTNTPGGKNELWATSIAFNFRQVNTVDPLYRTGDDATFLPAEEMRIAAIITWYDEYKETIQWDTKRHALLADRAPPLLKATRFPFHKNIESLEMRTEKQLGDHTQEK